MANEKRLIDANALLAEIERIYTEHYEKSAYKFIHDFFRAMRRRVRIAPTVDAVEVVRCKDCKYFVKGEPYDPCECMKWMVKFGAAYTTPDGYCHKAERKDENP